MYYGKICILLLAVMTGVFADTDYCDVSLCGEGKKHIACGNNGNFARICILPQIVNITSDYKRLITKKHNVLRNKIAAGFQNFPPANRMATIQWDNELARLAELNVKRCQMWYDQCRNTPKFAFAGQNIASTSWRGVRLNEAKVTESQILDWFNEYKNCPVNVIKSFKPSNGAFSRFATMMQDKATRVGCAILRTISCSYTQQIMACNYAYDNILGAPVYSEGQTASQCITGTNSRFNSLCSVREKYNLK